MSQENEEYQTESQTEDPIGGCRALFFALLLIAFVVLALLIVSSLFIGR